MALNSILTNVAAQRAHSSVGAANNAATASVARLSSGDRIQRAADDVAALSAGTSLQTNVVTLRRAMLNTMQGGSLLQVADGALAQITDVLQRQKAIAVQAGSGSLTPSERGFLNQEFQNLTAEIDRLARETNFNGVKLLDGSLFDVTFLEQDTADAIRPKAALTFTGNLADQKITVLNGVTVEFDDAGDGANAGGSLIVDTTAIAGGTSRQYVAALANALNSAASPLINAATYAATDDTLTITSRLGGIVGEEYVVNAATSNTDFNISAAATNEAGYFTLQGSSDRGLAAGETIGLGVIGDSIVAAHNQTRSFATLNFVNSVHNPPVASDFADGDLIIFDDGDTLAGPNVTFEFDTDGATGANNVVMDISNAGTKEQVLDVIVAAINNYTGQRPDGSVPNDDYLFTQFEARREGETVVITTRDTGVLVDKSTSLPPIVQPVDISAIANSTLTGSGVFQNGQNTGITASGISNPDFIGTVQGFKASFSGTTNVVDFEITVGQRSYTASGVTVSNNARLRFFSAEGDYFDVDFVAPAANLPVDSQEEADLLAVRLDKAFSSITFFQDRDIESYIPAGDIQAGGEPIGTLTGSSFTLQKSDFTAARIDDIFVGEPLEGTNDGLIEFTINGVVYRSQAGIGSELGSNGVFRFTSLENANDVLTLRTGNINLSDSGGNPVTSIEFDSEVKAMAVEDALKKAFGIGESGQTLNFQVGVSRLDRLAISISSVTSERLYNGQTLNVLNKQAATEASNVLDDAIDRVTGVRAEVGSLQSRFDFASANIESSVQNQEAARGVLLDTDVANESTQFASGQVRLQAGISVLAQANLIPQNLLKLIGADG